MFLISGTCFSSDQERVLLFDPKTMQFLSTVNLEIQNVYANDEILIIYLNDEITLYEIQPDTKLNKKTTL